MTMQPTPINSQRNGMRPAKRTEIDVAIKLPTNKITNKVQAAINQDINGRISREN